MDKDSHDRILKEKGRPMTLRRPSSGGAPVTNTDVTVYGKVFGSTAAELVGDLVQGIRRVRFGTPEIIAAAWPAPPRVNDQVIVGGKTYTVDDVDTRDIGGEVWAYILTVRG